MSEMGISVQPGCVLSFRHNFLFGKIWGKFGPEEQKFAKQEIKPKTQNTPTQARNAPFAHLGAPGACQSVVLLVHIAKPRHSGRVFGAENGPEKAATWARRQKLTQTGNYV